MNVWNYLVITREKYAHKADHFLSLIQTATRDFGRKCYCMQRLQVVDSIVGTRLTDHRKQWSLLVLQRRMQRTRANSTELADGATLPIGPRRPESFKLRYGLEQHAIFNGNA
jgi:hypothetical protein